LGHPNASRFNRNAVAAMFHLDMEGLGFNLVVHSEFFGNPPHFT
jgi:hypothetical protein